MDESNKSANVKWFEVSTFILSIAAVFIAVGAYLLSERDAKTDLYVDFKKEYVELTEFRGKVDKPILIVSIDDCSLLLEYEMLLGDPNNFSSKCKIKYYKDTQYYSFVKDYWQHSFNEWFASNELGLSQSLWRNYYRHAIFNSMNKHQYSIVLCELINGGSSFGGQVRRFRSALANLYQSPDVVYEYLIRFGLESDVSFPSRLQLSKRNPKSMQEFVSPLNCVGVDHQSTYKKNGGFKTSLLSKRYNLLHEQILKRYKFFIKNKCLYPSGIDTLDGDFESCSYKYHETEKELSAEELKKFLNSVSSELDPKDRIKDIKQYAIIFQSYK